MPAAAPSHVHRHHRLEPGPARQPSRRARERPQPPYIYLDTCSYECAFLTKNALRGSDTRGRRQFNRPAPEIKHAGMPEVSVDGEPSIAATWKWGKAGRFVAQSAQTIARIL